MEKNIDHILKQYQAGRIDRATANAELEAAGAGYHLEELTAEERAAKAAREYREGYIPAAEPAEPVQRTVDKSRRKDLVGKPKWEREIVQKTAHGTYRVEYDDQGYCVKATRI